MCPGGEEEHLTTNTYTGVRSYAKSSSAYMLVYIRDSDWNRIMSEPKEEDIDPALRGRFAVREGRGVQWAKTGEEESKKDGDRRGGKGWSDIRWLIHTSTSSKECVRSIEPSKLSIHTVPDEPLASV